MSSKSSLIFTQRFKVGGHQVNSDRYLSIPALLRSMQECSLQHARILKTSIWDMEEDHFSWVLLRKELKILRSLQLDDVYTIITYPSGIDKFFAYRDYLVLNGDKKLVATASSTWALINVETRKLSMIPEKIRNIGAPENVKFLVRAEKSLKIGSDINSVDTRRVRPYDLDWNNHVSNLVLIRFMMESLLSYGIKDNEVSKLLVHFKNEVRLDEEIKVFLDTGEDGLLHSILKSTDQKTIAVSRAELNKK